MKKFRNSLHTLFPLRSFAVYAVPSDLFHYRTHMHTRTYTHTHTHPARAILYIRPGMRRDAALSLHRCLAAASAFTLFALLVSPARPPVLPESAWGRPGGGAAAVGDGEARHAVGAAVLPRARGDGPRPAASGWRRECGPARACMCVCVCVYFPCTHTRTHIRTRTRTEKSQN